MLAANNIYFLTHKTLVAISIILFNFNEMHYLLLTFSLILHYLYRYIGILNVFIYIYEQLSAIKNLFYYIITIKNAFNDKFIKTG